MPSWLSKLFGSPRVVERHRYEIEVRRIPGQTEEDQRAMMREVEDEMTRQATKRGGPEETHAAVEEIVRRHGGTIDRFEAR